jgi:parallel beta-helix repeat protein
MLVFGAEGDSNMRRIVSGMILAFLLLVTFTLAFNSERVRAQTWTVTINSDGSIFPATALVSTVDNVTYTLTGNISGNAYGGIMIERSNAIVDGAGHSIQGLGTGDGVYISNTNNVTITNMEIRGFGNGLVVDGSNETSISGNSMTANTDYGIDLFNFGSSSIVGNNVEYSGDGIFFHVNCIGDSCFENNVTKNSNWGIVIFDGCFNESVSENNVAANSGDGIYLENSDNDTVSANNITTNMGGALVINYNSDDNTVVRNNITDNSGGINLLGSSGNFLRNNSMTGNAASFRVEVNQLSDGLNDVDVSNTVDGKPVCYWVSEYDKTVPLDAGYVALINCTSITVQNLNLTKNGQGIFLAYTSDSTITQDAITSNGGNGVELYRSCNNNNISDNNVTSNMNGVVLYACNNNDISGNNIAANNMSARLNLGNWGIDFESTSSNNTVSENNITSNENTGVRFIDSCGNNTVFGNNITGSYYGIDVEAASGNIFYYNNVIGNFYQVFWSSSATWDDGYPSGGNYWGDYSGTDHFGGPYQNLTGSDGIGDAPYKISDTIVDRYPLMSPVFVFNAGSINGTPSSICVVSNSTLSEFQVNSTKHTVSFNVSGTAGTIGFCRVTLPTSLIQGFWNGSYTVLFNGESWPFTQYSDANNTCLYISYTLSEHQIMIVPEFAPLLVLPLLLIATLLVVVIYRRKIKL